MRIAVLDIGGTSIKSGIWDGSRLTKVEEHKTCASEGGAALMRRVTGILQGLGVFEAIGLATAGQVDTEAGIVLYANPNLPGYSGMPVRRILQETFGVPVAVENDVNAAAIGELYCGAAVGTPDFLCLTYGTGVGGAIVLNGEVYHGSHFSGGYFGGILTHAGTGEAPRASGAAPGNSVSPMETASTYEECASVTALVRRAMETDPSLTDGRKIFDAFEFLGVRSVIDAWIDEVVYGLLSLVHVFDPPLIILGGGIMEQPYVIGEVRRRTVKALEPGFREVTIVGAELGNTAGLTGVAIIASRLSRSDFK